MIINIHRAGSSSGCYHESALILMGTDLPSFDTSQPCTISTGKNPSKYLIGTPTWALIAL